MPVLVPDIAEQCLILNGVAKTYAMTGWRVGWLIGPNDVVKAATNFQSHATSNVNNVAQRATIAALNGGLDDVAMMRAAFDRRGTTMHRMLSDIDGVTCMEPQGAFYCFPNVSGLLDRELDGTVAAHHARARRSRARDDRRWRSCPARRSARLATRGSRSRSATTISSRASAASPSSPPADQAPTPTTAARARSHDPGPRCAGAYVTRQSSSVWCRARIARTPAVVAPRARATPASTPGCSSSVMTSTSSGCVDVTQSVNGSVTSCRSRRRPRSSSRGDHPLASSTVTVK